MVSNDVVLQTVKRMIATGVDNATIRMTLKGINLSDTEISAVIDEARGQNVQGGHNPQPEAEEPAASEQAAEPDGPETDYPEDESTGDASQEDYAAGEPEVDADLKGELQSSAQEQIARHETTQNILEQHTDKMEELHKDISGLHSKLDSAPKLSNEELAKLGALDVRISGLEKEISETKANTIALQELLKKILETNRKSLLELQKRK